MDGDHIAATDPNHALVNKIGIAEGSSPRCVSACSVKIREGGMLVEINRTGQVKGDRNKGFGQLIRYALTESGIVAIDPATQRPVLFDLFQHQVHGLVYFWVGNDKGNGTKLFSTKPILAVHVGFDQQRGAGQGMREGFVSHGFGPQQDGIAGLHFEGTDAFHGSGILDGRQNTGTHLRMVFDLAEGLAKPVHQILVAVVLTAGIRDSFGWKENILGGGTHLPGVQRNRKSQIIPNCLEVRGRMNEHGVDACFFGKNSFAKKALGFQPLTKLAVACIIDGADLRMGSQFLGEGMGGAIAGQLAQIGAESVFL